MQQSLSPRAGQPFDAERRFDRSKLYRFFVPCTSLSHVGREAQDTPFGQKGRIECHAELERGPPIAGTGRAFQQEPSRGDVTTLQELLGAIDQRGDFLRIERLHHLMMWFRWIGPGRQTVLLLVYPNLADGLLV
jgi:hypothetical protein